MNNLLRVDKEGIPKIIQRVKYQKTNYSFKIRFFDGREMFMDCKALIPFPPNIQDGISKEQADDAMIIADRTDKKLFAVAKTHRLDEKYYGR